MTSIARRFAGRRLRRCAAAHGTKTAARTTTHHWAHSCLVPSHHRIRLMQCTARDHASRSGRIVRHRPTTHAAVCIAATSNTTGATHRTGRPTAAACTTSSAATESTVHAAVHVPRTACVCARRAGGRFRPAPLRAERKERTVKRTARAASVHERRFLAEQIAGIGQRAADGIEERVVRVLLQVELVRLLLLLMRMRQGVQMDGRTGTAHQ